MGGHGTDGRLRSLELKTDGISEGATFATLDDTQTLTNKTIVGGKFDKLYDEFGNLAIDCNPGGADPVNYLIVTSGGAGGAVGLQPEGTDTDISLNVSPKGAGTLTEQSVPVALSSDTVIADSTALDVPGIVADFNTLLAALRLCRITKAS